MRCFAVIRPRVQDSGQEHCLFHPLSNDMTISLSARELDKFLKSIGRDPLYVDFEASPRVGKDQPPDLAALAPSSSIVLPDQPEKQPSLQVPTNGNCASVDNKSKTISGEDSIKCDMQRSSCIICML